MLVLLTGSSGSHWQASTASVVQPDSEASSFTASVVLPECTSLRSTMPLALPGDWQPGTGSASDC